MSERFMKNYNGEKIFSLEYDKETLRDMVIAKQEENELLQDRIDKAIEYIEEHFEKEYNKPKEELKKYNLKNCTYDTSLVVLDILKGSDKE